LATAAPLPELAAVPWRPLVTAGSLQRRGRIWTLSTVAHVVPFVAVAVGLMLLNPLAAPVAVAALAHAWLIPELYALRGANVVRPRPDRRSQIAERTAQGLLGDLLGHEARELQRSTGLALERGELGTWLVGEAGALLVANRRVYCFCVRATDPELPPSDRVAHLLLALRSDEAGFATVANLAFAGAPWRVRRRLERRAKEALDVARRQSVRRAPQPSFSR
jgi:hypothetical protein